MASCNIAFDQKQMLTDLLSSEKFLAGIYNSDVLESATPHMRSCFCGILSDEHKLGQELFEEMSNRGYYPVETAKEEKLHEAKQQYAQCAMA